MLRSLISNKIVKRFCHTHSKSNFCKFNDKIINIENHMKKIIAVISIMNCITLTMIIFRM